MWECCCESVSQYWGLLFILVAVVYDRLIYVSGDLYSKVETISRVVWCVMAGGGQCAGWPWLYRSLENVSYGLFHGKSDVLVNFLFFFMDQSVDPSTCRRPSIILSLFPSPVAGRYNSSYLVIRSVHVENFRVDWSLHQKEKKFLILLSRDDPLLLPVQREFLTCDLVPFTVSSGHRNHCLLVDFWTD